MTTNLRIVQTALPIFLHFVSFFAVLRNFTLVHLLLRTVLAFGLWNNIVTFQQLVEYDNHNAALDSNIDSDIASPDEIRNKTNEKVGAY